MRKIQLYKLQCSQETHIRLQKVLKEELEIVHICCVLFPKKLINLIEFLLKSDMVMLQYKMIQKRPSQNGEIDNVFRLPFIQKKKSCQRTDHQLEFPDDELISESLCDQ